MLRSLLLVFTFVFSASAFCQNKVILTIDGNPVSVEEFERLYKKNNQNLLEESEQKNPVEYMELFVNYKLKVHEAEQLGLDTIDSFVRELKSYRDELAKPYLTDVQFSDIMVQEAYARMKNEVKASHILLRLNENASPADTLTTYNKILSIRNRILAGENFENVAFEVSEDPSVKMNKGILGYFSAFQMVFPFEQAAYKTEIGDISMPVRSRFGYHLIHVLDKRPALGQIKVAHIMKRLPSNASEEAVNKAKQKLDSVAALIQSGAQFAEMAKEFSDDRQTAQKGGDMSWITSSFQVAEFIEAAFALENNGDVSPVIRTPYGWHLIQRLDRKPIPAFEEVEQMLVERIKKNPEISEHSKQMFVNKLKAEYNFKVDRESQENYYSEVMGKLKTDNGQGALTSSPQQVLCTFADKKLTFSDFSNFITNYNGSKNNLSSLFEKFIEKQLTNYEDANLENKYPDFKYLMKEYHDGILLFNISEKKVWNAASEDSLGLASFYNNHKDKYLWDERFKGWVIKCPNQEVKDLIDQIFAEDDKMTIEELNDQIKQHIDIDVEIEKGTFEKGDNPLVDYYVFEGSEPEVYINELHFVRGNKIAPQAKSLEDAKGLYISDYQNYLEKEWIKKMRKKYKVKVNKKILKTIEPV